MIFKASDYLNRNDLEKGIKARDKLDGEEYLISGTREELRVLNLDDTKTVYGVKVIITDTPTTELLKDKIKDKK